MDAQKQQIIGYFIEEAREHMETIERALLNLQLSCDDPEQMNQLFRAAHSVKGGANMLGFKAVGHVAHRMEDCFKILKEHPVPIDRQIEDLFLKGFDTLQDVLGTISSNPSSGDEARAEQSAQQAEPIFIQLQTYLEKLSGQSPRLPDDFNNQVMGVLREILALFKQADAPATRQKLQTACDRLAQIGEACEPWIALIQASKQAIGNPQANFKSLAPLVITELKDAAQQAQNGQGAAIKPSANLQKIGAAAVAPQTVVAKTVAPTPAIVPPVAEPTPKITVTVTSPVAAPPVASAPTLGANEIAIPKDPKGAAQVLVKTFDRKQLTELAQILIKVIKG